MRFLTAALFLMALPAAAQQQQANPPAGAGSDSCAVFNNNLKENKADPQLQWVVGYLNGWNELGKSLKKPDLLQHATLPGLQQFVAIYCQQYPDGTMAAAASVIADFLGSNTTAVAEPAPPPPKPAEPPRARPRPKQQPRTGTAGASPPGLPPPPPPEGAPLPPDIASRLPSLAAPKPAEPIIIERPRTGGQPAPATPPAAPAAPSAGQPSGIIDFTKPPGQ